MHLSDELLSAYLDGEITLSEAAAAAAHLRTCAGCTETARVYAALDERLTSIPALVCASALTLVSAQLDGELDGEESAIAATHLAGCAVCRSSVLRWSVADQALAALPPARPSARVDAAIVALGREPQGRLPRIAWPVPALAVAAAMSLLIVFNLSIGPASPVGPNTALVAAVQQSVLNPATGILYVLHPENGTVAAIDAQTLQSRMVITVGGRPTALALNQATNTILVLDATAKTVTEIDGVKNIVTSSTTVAVPGTPTSLQVDPNGNVVVMAVVAPPAAQAAAPALAAPPAGIVAVFNGSTKRLESVKQVDVAPQVFVLEPNGRRALLVSAEATTLVDATTYQPLAAAAGGVAAAFAATGDDFAILSKGANGASVSFARRGGALSIGGTPRAIAALPDGGFAVISDQNGRGIITLIADGAIVTTLDAPANASNLAYDASIHVFAVVGASGGVASVPLPGVVAQLPRATGSPAPTGSPLPTANTSPTPSPSVTASPTPAPTEPVALVAPPERNGLAPAGAREVWAGTYLVSVGVSKRPDRAISDGRQIWYVDDLNRVNVLHTMTGELFTQVAALPSAANIGLLAISPSHVYFIDQGAGTVYVLTISTEQVAAVSVPFAKSTTAIVASPDERLWLATVAAGLVSYDPRTGRIETVAVGEDLSALATDALGRIWIAARERQAVDVYDPLTGLLTELALAHSGAVTALAVDKGGTVWTGTNSGQAFAIRNAVVTLTAAVAGPIDAFVLDDQGAAWLVSGRAGGLTYGRATEPGALQNAPVGTSGPMFDPLGRIWQADRAADGFYVTLPGARP